MVQNRIRELTGHCFLLRIDRPFSVSDCTISAPSTCWPVNRLGFRPLLLTNLSPRSLPKPCPSISTALGQYTPHLTFSVPVSTRSPPSPLQRTHSIDPTTDLTASLSCHPWTHPSILPRPCHPQTISDISACRDCHRPSDSLSLPQTPSPPLAGLPNLTGNHGLLAHPNIR